MLPAARHREAITESLISGGRVPEGPGAEWSRDPDSNFHVPGSGRTQNAKSGHFGTLYGQRSQHSRFAGADPAQTYSKDPGFLQ